MVMQDCKESSEYNCRNHIACIYGCTLLGIMLPVFTVVRSATSSAGCLEGT